MCSIVTKLNSIKNIPLIVVLGATGTGKSKLALELASKYNGEIISADSMQVYKGLDIITNKVTKQEKELIPHHLLDIIDSNSRFTVQDFRNAALPLIDQLQKSNKMPIIVGGTNYYIESLLWKVLIDSVTNNVELLYERDKTEYINQENNILFNAMEGSTEKLTKDETVSQKKFWCDSKLPTQELFNTLQTLDLEMAAIHHPNERRKILRSLQVLEQTGIRHSQLLKEQSAEDGGGTLGGPLRFPKAVVFWIYCEQNVLDPRLDARVDEMIKLGLLKELEDFHTDYNVQHLTDNTPPLDEDNSDGKDLKPSHYETGIFQSIGFKEFHKYLILSEEERASKHGQELYKDGIDRLKLVTRRYSRRQIKWIRNRFFLNEDREKPDIYRLDGTDVAKWTENVLVPAEKVLDALISGEKTPIPPHKIDPKSTITTYAQRIDKTKHRCEVCNTVLIGTIQYEAHMNGKKHRKTLQALKRDSKKRSLSVDSEDDCVTKHSKNTEEMKDTLDTKMIETLATDINER